LPLLSSVFSPLPFSVFPFSSTLSYLFSHVLSARVDTVFLSSFVLSLLSFFAVPALSVLFYP
jgi:uncharacterized protein YybS (DUF2232 family)